MNQLGNQSSTLRFRFPHSRSPKLALMLDLATHGAFTERVVAVYDGDTIGVLHGGREERIRLSGIDAPEKRQAFGQRAKQAISDLVLGTEVTVETKSHDKYGRTLAEVRLPDGRSLNQELVRQGRAWQYQRYSKDSDLARLEQEARIARRGLWSEPNPVPSWEWRKHRR